MYCVKSIHIYFRAISITQICCDHCDLCCPKATFNWSIFFSWFIGSKKQILNVKCSAAVNQLSILIHEKEILINKEWKHAAWKSVGGSNLLTRRWLEVCGRQTGEQDSGRCCLLKAVVCFHICISNFHWPFFFFYEITCDYGLMVTAICLLLSLDGIWPASILNGKQQHRISQY